MHKLIIFISISIALTREARTFVVRTEETSKGTAVTSDWNATSSVLSVNYDDDESSVEFNQDEIPSRSDVNEPEPSVNSSVENIENDEGVQSVLKETSTEEIDEYASLMIKNERNSTDMMSPSNIDESVNEHFDENKNVTMINEETLEEDGEN